jgi:flagellar hook-basal body complex protein FliE
MSSMTFGSVGNDLLAQLRDLQREQRGLAAPVTGGKTEPGPSFTDLLTQGVKDVDQSSKAADKAGTELATGRTDNLHETMLAATQAELSFNLMVQLRNKALEAYSEIMRMPV